MMTLHPSAAVCATNLEQFIQTVDSCGGSAILNKPKLPRESKLKREKDFSAKNRKRTCTSQTLIKDKSTKKFQKLFNMETCEVLLKTYSCALAGEILFQGTLYISPGFLCFHSNIFGSRHKMRLPFTDIVNITRRKTVGFIPNAIAIETKATNYFFTSFISRENTITYISELWHNNINQKLVKLEEVKEKLEASTESSPLDTDEANSTFKSPPLLLNQMKHKSTSMNNIYYTDILLDHKSTKYHSTETTSISLVQVQITLFILILLVSILFCAFVYQYQRVTMLQNQLIERIGQFELLFNSENKEILNEKYDYVQPNSEESSAQSYADKVYFYENKLHELAKSLYSQIEHIHGLYQSDNTSTV